MTNPVLPRKRNWFHNRWLIVGIVVVVMACGAITILFINNMNTAAAAIKSTGTVTVARGNLISSVTGSGTVAAEQLLNLTFQNGGTITEVLVKAGDTVTIAQPIARLDDRLLQSQLANAQAGLASAQARLTQAQKGNARPEDIAAAQAALKSAQAAYDAAVKSAGTTSSQLTAAEAAMNKTETALRQAQSSYDMVSWRADIGMLPQATTLQNATNDYKQAKANYETLKTTAGSDAESKIQTAAAQLEQAKTNLAKLTAPATATDLAIQQAAVAQAEQSLKQAQLNLDAATLKAPFAGIVTIANIVPGSQVGSSNTIATLIDRSRLHVDLRLNENDAVRVRTNQPVSLTIDSLPDWQVQGTVSYVAPAAEVINGVVTYAVRILFPDNDPRVKIGMTTNVSIMIARRENVLLVPNSALLPKGTGRAVQIPSEGKEPIESDVQIGLTDGVMTEITFGLNEGDRIVAAPAPVRKGGIFSGD